MEPFHAVMPIWRHPPVLGLALLLVLGEYVWRRQRGRSYDLKAAGVSLGIAVGQSLLRPLNAALTFAALAFMARFAPWHLPLNDWRTWAVGFVAVELAYYWFHRLSHTVAWMWATHSVHHSAREMVLPAAIRLGWTESLSLGWLCFLPLALLGFPPVMIAVLLGANLLYQFVLHTEAPVSLGPLEGVLNTPRHHRAHHSSESAYLDCNFGGVLIVFDRLFGTFRPGPDPATPLAYGLVHPRGTGVLAVALGGWGELLPRIAAARGWQAKVRVALGRPA